MSYSIYLILLYLPWKHILNLTTTSNTTRHKPTLSLAWISTIAFKLIPLLLSLFPYNLSSKWPCQNVFASVLLWWIKYNIFSHVKGHYYFHFGAISVTYFVYFSNGLSVYFLLILGSLYLERDYFFVWYKLHIFTLVWHFLLVFHAQLVCFVVFCLFLLKGFNFSFILCLLDFESKKG